MRPLHVKTLKMARPRPRNRAIPRRAARASDRPAAGPRAQSETEGQRQALVTEGIAASNLVVFVCTDEHNPFNSRLLASAFHTAYREGKKQLLVANSPTVRPCPGTGAPPTRPCVTSVPPAFVSCSQIFHQLIAKDFSFRMFGAKARARPPAAAAALLLQARGVST